MSDITIDYVVMNIRPNDTLGWIAESLNGEMIKVEPDNYDFYFISGGYTVYTRKSYEEGD